MAMEFGKLSKMSVGEVAKSAATEGGAVVAGLLGSGFLGKQIENMVKKGVVPASSTTDKLLAYAGNNAPKLALYYLLRKEGRKFLSGYEVDIGKGALSSVVLDTLVRTGNKGAPGTTVKVFGIDLLGEQSNGSVDHQMQQNMQKVLQENSSLRQQLNGAMQRIASPNVIVTPMQSAQSVRPANDMQRQRVVPPVGTLGSL